MKQAEKLKLIEEQVQNLKNNQEHVIEAVKNLNSRFGAIESVLDREKQNTFKDILNSQEMLDELLVKNSDDIKLLKNWKNDNMELLEQISQEIIKITKTEKEIMEKINDSPKQVEFE